MIRECERSKRGARFRVPAAVDPRAGDHEVHVLFVMSFRGLIDVPRAPWILLVPKSRYVKVRNRRLFLKERQKVHVLPMRIIIRMRDVIVPALDFSVQIV